MHHHFPFKLIDMTHTLSDVTPTWVLDCGYRQHIEVDYDKNLGNLSFRVNSLQMPAGCGTHMDAPAHRFPNGLSIDEIPLDNLLSPAICIDVSNKADEHYLISTDDILSFEKAHGMIPKNSVVIFYTGWAQHWKNKKRYHNRLQCPSVSEEVALLLLERNIHGLGIDTLSPDVGSSDFPVHKHLLGANKYIIENVANAIELPSTGAYVLVAALKGKGLTEAPVRLIGFV